MVLGHIPRPPVDLGNIARKLGVQDVRRSTTLDGYTDFRQDRPVVYLSPAFTRERVRFVFAHELAHVIIRRLDAQELIDQRDATSLMRNEERLANNIAGTLLIPDDWVQAFRDTDITFSRIKDAASIAEVSLAMMVTRLAAANVNVALLRWQRNNSSWHLVDRPGTPHSLHSVINLTENSIRILDELVTDELRIVLEGFIEGARLRIRGNVQRNGKYAAQLIRPSSDLWFGPRKNHDVTLVGARDSSNTA
jgi:Zn-dependent peptidase ImmA (M78 family)